MVRFAWRVILGHGLGLVLPVFLPVLLLGMATGATPAVAQGFGWFGNLFGGTPPATTRPHAPSHDRQADGRVRTRHRDTPRVSRDGHPPTKNASVFIYVLGDTFGQTLASGLDEALADRQDVAVIHQAKGSTGLVTSDVFDWPKAVDTMLAAERVAKPGDGAPIEPGKHEAETDPSRSTAVGAAKGKAKADANHVDVAVMMIGSNDRQAIRLDGETLGVGTPEWTAEYKRRVMAIDEAFQRKGVPLVWVGVPITRDDGFADDMAAFNDIYREAAAKTGAVFVDTWEAFSDDNGDFSAVGPDINGQITRLRMADGIYFTRAGSRKLAHFVEAHVRRALDGKMAPAPLPETATPAAAVARKPDVGQISSLAEAPLSRGGHLAEAYRADALVEASIVKGSPLPAPAGRADDLKWPPAGGAQPVKP